MTMVDEVRPIRVSPIAQTRGRGACSQQHRRSRSLWAHSATTYQSNMLDRKRRTAHLRQMLRDRRREVQGEVQRRLSGRRTARLRDVSDELEDSDAHVQGDIDLALLQMKVETVARIDASLARLKAGQYGRCVECERPITERRLRALPFALRCQACEQRREQDHKTGRRLADHGRSVFPDMAGT